MKAIITNDKLEIQDNTLYNSGSIQYYEIDVEFSSDWEGLTKYAVLVGAEKIKLPVVGGKLHVDQRTSGTYTIGFVGYTLEDDEKVYQISTNLEYIYFQTGAGEIEANEPSDLPDPTTWETYLSEIQAIVNGAENVNISIEKIDDTTYITTTDKTGTATTTEIIDGKDAKINGVNTISIEGGENVTIEQEGSTLTISATDTTDYTELSNKPSINGVELSGNKTSADLNIKQTYNKSDVGLGNVDNVRQYSASNPPPYPVNSVNGQTGAVVIDTHDDLIPTQASSSNKLTTENFVNSTVATSTATFRGTYNSLAELEQVSADENDYGFVVSTDSAGNTVYNRYKYASGTWVFEYALNNSSFTAAQWEAIQSGITSGLVTKLQGIEAGAEVNVVEGLKIGNTTQEISNKIIEINPDTTPTQGSNNVIDSNAVYEVEKLLPTDRESGENVDIDNAQPYKVLDIVADGKYQQGDNPSPDNPQTITQVTSATWNRTGKQLFDKDNANIIRSYFNSSTTTISDNANSYTTVYMPCKTNTTYTISKLASARFSCGYTTETPAQGVSVAGVVTDNTASSITISTGVNAQYIVAFVRHASYDTLTEQQILDSLMIAEGTDTTYSPYQGQSIQIDLDGNEVCATDTIKDKLLVDRYGNVAIQKNVGKVVFNGSEDWEQNGNATLTNSIYLSSTVIDNTKSENTNGISNYFTVVTTGLWNTDIEGIQLTNSERSIRVRIGKDKATGVGSFKTWLSTHNTIIYYELATPTIIPLPKLSILPSTLKGINHIWIDTNLGTTQIEVEYVKDLSMAIPTSVTDLTDGADYVKNTDYATTTKGGVIKSSTTYGTNMYSGFLFARTYTFANYNSGDNAMFISKGTLENWYAGKGLVSSIVKTTLDNILNVNTQYYLGTQSSLNLTLPSTASAGDIITVDFESGTTATTLSISGNIAGDIDYTPIANSLVELNFKYDGTYWKMLVSSINTPTD